MSIIADLEKAVSFDEKMNIIRELPDELFLTPLEQKKDASKNDVFLWALNQIPELAELKKFEEIITLCNILCQKIFSANKKHPDSKLFNAIITKQTDKGYIGW